MEAFPRPYTYIQSYFMATIFIMTAVPAPSKTPTFITNSASF